MSTSPDPASKSTDKKPAKTTTTLELTPQYMQYARTSAKRGANEEKAVAMVLVMRSNVASEQPEKPDETSEKPPSATVAEGAEAVFPFNFGKIKPGTEITREAFLGVKNPPDEDNKKPLVDLTRIITVPGDLSNLNFYAFVTETPDENKALSLLTKTLENQDASLQKALNTLFANYLKPPK